MEGVHLTINNECCQAGLDATGGCPQLLPHELELAALACHSCNHKHMRTLPPLPAPLQRAQGAAARRGLCGSAGPALPAAARLVGWRAEQGATQRGCRRQRAAAGHAG